MSYISIKGEEIVKTVNHWVLFILVFINFIFRAILSSQQNWVKVNEIFHIFPRLHICTASPILNILHSPHTPLSTSLTINIPHKRGAFITVSEPTLAYYYQSKPVVYIWVYSWYCIFHRFWQIYNDICSQFLYHTL